MAEHIQLTAREAALSAIAPVGFVTDWHSGVCLHCDSRVPRDPEKKYADGWGDQDIGWCDESKDEVDWDSVCGFDGSIVVCRLCRQDRLDGTLVSNAEGDAPWAARNRTEK